MSNNVYIIKIEGGEREMLESFTEAAGDLEFSDNIIVTNAEVESLCKNEAKKYFQSLADAMDAEVVFNDEKESSS